MIYFNLIDLLKKGILKEEKKEREREREREEVHTAACNTYRFEVT